MAAYTQDDGFHEIQLNGKQLVFLFMAATVVSVVIFLCGVLVGRGVRAQRGDLAQSVASTDLSPAPTTEVTRPATSSPDPTAPPPPAVDDLSYFKRLEKPTPADETLAKEEPEKEPVPPTPVPPTPAAAPAPAPVRSEPPRRSETVAAVETKPAAPPKESPAAAVESPSAAPGYAVQVAALNVRSEADAMAKRLSSKGYSAYVLTSANGAPIVYRVRVGAFKTRREAEVLAARLQKEEQIKPWVTR